MYMQTILVVEDEWSIADMIIALLSDAGFNVVVTASGEEALACLDAVWPKLILSNVMPVSQLEAARSPWT